MRLLPVPGVFQPHSDSMMLAQQLEREQVAGSRVLDLCTGSGALAVTAALCGAREVVAVDVSRRALLSVTLNGALNGRRVRAVRGDLFAPLGAERFDLIVSNPPYLPGPAALPRTGVDRAWEGGPTGRAFIDRICSEAGGHLREDGVLLLVQSSVCGPDETLSRLSASGLHATIVERRRGALGPRLRARRDWLQERRLVGEDGTEEIVVIRAQRRCSPAAAQVGAPDDPQRHQSAA